MKGCFFMKKLVCFILILMLTLSFSSCFDYNNKTIANTKKLLHLFTPMKNTSLSRKLARAPTEL